MELEKLINKDIKLNDSEEIIWQYIINHIEDISKISSRELARLTYTHPTTILRFVKKLGFVNYNDFKIHIAINLKNLNTNQFIISKDEELLSLQNKIASLNINVINKMRTLLNVDELKLIYQLLNKHQYIDFIATELNEKIALYASHMFFSEGKICQVYKEKTQQLFYAKNVKKDHIVFLIGKTGKNEQTIEIAKELRKRGIITIAITSYKNGLSKICDYSLLALYSQDFNELGDMIFSTSVKYIFDVLYAMLFSQSYEDILSLNEDYLKQFYSSYEI